MTPTLSQVRSYDPSHLSAAAAHWDTLARTWDDTWSTARDRVAGAAWGGAGHDAAVAAHTADLAAAGTSADGLRAAAAAARTGHDNLVSMKSALIADVDAAQHAGYQVNEIFIVSPPPDMPAWMVAAKAPDMVARTGQLQARAAALFAYDGEVSAQISAPAATFAASPFKPDMPIPATLTDFKTAPADPSPIAPWDQPDPKPPSVLPQLQQALTAPPSTAAPGPPMPAYTGQPPGMTALPPGPPFDPAPATGPAEKNPEFGPLIAGAGGGCAGGAGIAAAIVSPFPPAEAVAPETGCVAGAAAAAGTYLGGIWLENLFNGNG